VDNVANNLNPAIAESIGPHQNVQFSHHKIPKGIVRKLYTDAWTVIKNVDTGEVNATEGFSIEETISKQKAINILENTDFSSEKETGDNNLIDSGTKERLERLGYL
jgi:hypothetical protein